MITKNIVLRNGFTASHWQCAERVFDDLNQVAFLKISGWKDASAKNAGAEAAHHFLHQFDGAAYSALSGLTVVQVENQIVIRIPAFSGGVVS